LFYYTELLNIFNNYNVPWDEAAYEETTQDKL